MSTAIDTVSAPPTCDARVSYTARPEGWGWTPIDCGQRVGLTAFRDIAGHTRHHCSRDGHRAAAVRRYGLWEGTESPGGPDAIEGCPGCIARAARGGPAHEASPRCESGRRPHCSCDVCW